MRAEPVAASPQRLDAQPGESTVTPRAWSQPRFCEAAAAAWMLDRAVALAAASGA